MKNNTVNFYNKGFTLIELLVVIAIIGILASVVLTSLTKARSRARDTQRISQLREVQKALELYYADNGTYPDGPMFSGCSVATWETSLTPLVSGKYIGLIPSDPLNVTTGTPQYCYNYNTFSTTASGWTCNGITRNNYNYTIAFSLENPNPNFPVSYSGGTFNYCVTGERR